MNDEVERYALPRDTWMSGPWDEEHNRVEWVAFGLPCLIIRNVLGAWCGYVAVPPQHPSHGKGSDELNRSVDVHGGLTYAGGGTKTIHHSLEAVQEIPYWYFGFDCAHADDVVPSFTSYFEYLELYTTHPNLTYKSEKYVKDETEKLAAQLVG